MIFNTPSFLFLFLPLVLLVALFLKREGQNLFLLLASLVFYAWGEGRFVMLLLASALVNHFLAMAIEKAGSGGKRMATLIAGLTFNILLLATFKYAGFMLTNLAPLLRGAGLAVGEPSWHQPMGISFFTFMAIAYLIEVHNRAVPAERNFLHTALFISFFPTIMAGPINRYSRFGRQIKERQTTPEMLAEGVRRFVIGLGKKVLLADTLAKVTDQIFAVPTADLTASLAWLAAACYTLQIFLDFAGYSDMAIGLGRMFGFTLMENFNYPYLSKSITEFWTRWHISLSTWLRDFLFLPMAYAISRRIRADRWLGIRADSWCYYPAMLLTMLLCGLWHGAAWTFVAWGLYLGAFIMLERFVLKGFLKRLWPPLQTVYALLVIGCGWVIFRAADFAQAAGFWRTMFGFGRGDGLKFHPALYLDNTVLIALIAAVPTAFAAGCAIQKIKDNKHLWLAGGYQILTNVLLLAMLLACAMRLAVSTYNPFIYFKF